MWDLASSWINWRSLRQNPVRWSDKLPNKFILPYNVGHSLYTRQDYTPNKFNRQYSLLLYLVFMDLCVESGRSLLTWLASSPPCPSKRSCLKKQGGQCLGIDTRRLLVSTCMNTCVHTHERTNTCIHTCDYIQKDTLKLGKGARVWGPRVNSQYIRQQQQQYVSFFSLVKGKEQNMSDLY